MTNLFLYNENTEKYKEWINQHQFYDETKPSVEFVKNGIILPPINPIKTAIAVYEGGGVIREDFPFVENSTYTRGKEEYWENPITKGYITKEYEYNDKVVMYAKFGKLSFKIRF